MAHYLRLLEQKSYKQVRDVKHYKITRETNAFGTENVNYRFNT